MLLRGSNRRDLGNSKPLGQGMQGLPVVTKLMTCQNHNGVSSGEDEVYKAYVLKRRLIDHQSRRCAQAGHNGRSAGAIKEARLNLIIKFYDYSGRDRAECARVRGAAERAQKSPGSRRKKRIRICARSHESTNKTIKPPAKRDRILYGYARNTKRYKSTTFPSPINGIKLLSGRVQTLQTSRIAGRANR